MGAENGGQNFKGKCWKKFLRELRKSWHRSEVTGGRKMQEKEEGKRGTQTQVR